jgi:putative nucleotidyltransferase with HDIG domain
MHTASTAYRILRSAYVLLAIILTCAAWRLFPTGRADWESVGWFVLFGVLTELLAVSLADESLVEVTPSAPIYWAAACVLGPALSITVCLASSVCADLMALLAHVIVRRTEARNKAFPTVLARIGKSWEHKSGITVIKALEASVAYPSALVLMVGLSSIAYCEIGGQYLVNGMPPQPLINFVFPFLALTAVAIGVDTVQYVLAVAVFDPLPASKGIRGFLLRLHLELIQTALPLMRAQVFLVVVSLMLAYLYVRVGAWAFVLTSLPVVALRDFYSHWVREQSAYLDTITTLATYMQHYHPYTRGHLKRVAELSERLARELRLPAESIRHISHAGLLHDIGKIGVSEVILDKTSKLEPEEWEKIKSHPVAGAEIISHLDFLEGIVDWIRYHHKWHDGRGYPDTNGAGMIPVEAAIIAVVDSFDAMTDDRELSLEWTCDSCGYRPADGGRPEACPECGATKGRTYRAPKTLDQAIDELRRGSGSQFHPAVVKAFLAMLDRDGVHLDAR